MTENIVSLEGIQVSITKDWFSLWLRFDDCKECTKIYNFTASNIKKLQIYSSLDI